LSCLFVRLRIALNSRSVTLRAKISSSRSSGLQAHSEKVPNDVETPYLYMQSKGENFATALSAASVARAPPRLELSYSKLGTCAQVFHRFWIDIDSVAPFYFSCAIFRPAFSSGLVLLLIVNRRGPAVWGTPHLFRLGGTGNTMNQADPFAPTSAKRHKEFGSGCVWKFKKFWETPQTRGNCLRRP